MKTIYTVSKVNNLYSLTFKETKTYLITSILIIGSLILPQLFHLIPNGGQIFIPIYFFTLIGSYKYGIRVGILLSVFSPITSFLIFGMPPLFMLFQLVLVSIILSIIASFIALKTKKISFIGIFIAVIFAQIVALFTNMFLSNSIIESWNYFTTSIPGMAFQLFGSYFMLKLLAKY